MVGFLIVTMALVPATSRAGKRVVLPPSISAEERTRVDGTKYYLIQIALPGEITTVRHAWLESQVDASSVLMDGFSDPAPLFEAYMLNAPLSGDPRNELFEETRRPMSRPLAAGAGRIAKVDVTEFIQKVIVSPSRNYGLVVGSVTIASRGTFAIDSERANLKLIVIE